MFSFDRMMNKQNPYNAVSGGQYLYFEGMGMPDTMKSVEKVDDYTVKITLNNPEAPFLADLVMGWASILSKEYADQLLKAGTPEQLYLVPIGTGPSFSLTTRRTRRSVTRRMPTTSAASSRSTS